MPRDYDPDKAFQDIQDFQKEFSKGMELRTKATLLLTDLQQHIAHYLALQKDRSVVEDFTEDSIREYLKNERAGVEDIPREDLLSLFREIGIVLDTPMRIEHLHRAGTGRPIHPFFNPKPCEKCGRPLPRGRRKYCSDSCGIKQRSNKSMKKLRNDKK